MPLFRSKHQPVLLAQLYLHEEQSMSLTDLSEATQIPYSTVSREVRRLAEVGLLQLTEQGRSKYVAPNLSSPYHRSLRTLVEQTFGPLPILREALANVNGIEEAFIYGSWASRYNEEPGPAPQDIDVLVIGDPSVKQLRSALRRIEERLRLEINPVIRSSAEWAKDTSGFKEDVLSKHRVPLVGS